MQYFFPSPLQLNRLSLRQNHVYAHTSSGHLLLSNPSAPFLHFFRQSPILSCEG